RRAVPAPHTPARMRTPGEEERAVLREPLDPAIEERIRARAYQIWEEEGRPAGRDVEHWIRAVLELARDGRIRMLPDGVLQTDGAGGDHGIGRGS
ncbi:MAG: DUF2934 domain-containing protein, partial [Candidatus Dormibacteria bacterium]